jgi:hypothetical protein
MALHGLWAAIAYARRGLEIPSVSADVVFDFRIIIRFSTKYLRPVAY